MEDSYDIEQLMQEAPHGEVYDEEYRGDGTVISDEREYAYHGMVAHRGVLHHMEYVDMEALKMEILHLLGFSEDGVTAAFSHANPTPDIKSAIEDKLLKLSEGGGNMPLLGAILGWRVRENGYCKTMHRALARARDRRDAGVA